MGEYERNPRRSGGFLGAQTESRTRDLRITSALLYQLSYLGNRRNSRCNRINVIGAFSARRQPILRPFSQTRLGSATDDR